MPLSSWQSQGMMSSVALLGEAGLVSALRLGVIEMMSPGKMADDGVPFAAAKNVHDGGGGGHSIVSLNHHSWR